MRGLPAVPPSAPSGGQEPEAEGQHQGDEEEEGEADAQGQGPYRPVAGAPVPIDEIEAREEAGDNG